MGSVWLLQQSALPLALARKVQSENKPLSILDPGYLSFLVLFLSLIDKWAFFFFFLISITSFYGDHFKD